MSRASVRQGVANILAGLVQPGGAKVFKSVWPVMPTFVDQKETPVAFVMIPSQKEERRGMQRKLIYYRVQVHTWFTGASIGWSNPGPNANLMVPPAGDPQVQFDAWLEIMFTSLRTNKAFSQNVPPAGAQSILLGEPTITSILSWPERDVESEYIICAAVIEMEAVEQLLGT